MSLATSHDIDRVDRHLERIDLTLDHLHRMLHLIEGSIEKTNTKLDELIALHKKAVDLGIVFSQATTMPDQEKK